MKVHWPTVAIVGVGLIGGSVGLALNSRRLAKRIIGVGRSAASLAEAKRRGAVTETTTTLAEGVADADLVVVAATVGTIGPLLEAVDLAVRPGTLITDAGSTKGSIVVGAPQGEHHSLVVAMVADLLRQRGWEVFDLGADLPAQTFIAAVNNTPDVVAACVSVTSPTARDAARELVLSLRTSVGDAVPIYVGGAAVLSAEDAQELGAHGWASDVNVLVELLEQD